MVVASTSTHRGNELSRGNSRKSDERRRSGDGRRDSRQGSPLSIRTHSSSPRQRSGDKFASVRRSIADLNQAIGHDRRVAAIRNACAEFDHWDDQKHNAELHFGAANVLSLVLSMTDDDDEVRMICAALEMVHRASHENVKSSFHEVGAAVVPLLLRLLERCESGNMKHADVSIMNVSKVLLYLSRVPDLRVPLARQQGMLDSLKRVATSILNGDCRILRMRILANLANCEANKAMMYEHDGLLESILKIATLDLSDSAREYASAALMDLASSSSNQVLMAQIDKVLGTLVKLAVIEDAADTREYAVTGLQNLAFAKDNRVRLVTYGQGVVLEALKKTVSTDPNDKARRRAAGALTNLACEDTAERMGCHKGLLETLAVVSTRDRNDDVQVRASLALTKVATSISCDMSCHETLLDALVVASLSANSNSVSAVLRVKARVAENRECMARHPGILDTLADIAAGDEWTTKDRDNAMRAIMHLTNENTNRIVMCNKVILDALVIGASLEGVDHEEIRDSAMVAIERLATEVSNRQFMARHDGLIVVIAKATERELKSEIRGEENSKPRLAKPLLMSLLVAM